MDFKDKNWGLKEASCFRKSHSATR